MRFTFLIFTCLIVLSACKHPLPEPPDFEGKIKIEIEHVAGDQNLILNTGVYTTSLGEKISVDILQYYLSNFQLTKSDGSLYTIPQDSCYFLINAEDASTHVLSLKHLPKDDYTALTFIMGVDSATNYAPVEEHIGALDLAYGMFWTWNDGHVFFKMEGTSPALSGASYHYHIAGAGGRPGAQVINNLKTVIIPFGQDVAVSKDIQPEVHLKADILKVFDGATAISVTEYTNIQSPNHQSGVIASNYSHLFSLDLIH